MRFSLFLKLFTILISLFSFVEINAETTEIKAFVYTEVQNTVPFNQVPWQKRNPIISSQPGFIYKTWLSGVGNNSVGGIYAFDSIENAQKYVTDFFPNALKKQNVAHTSRIFNATIVKKASIDMGSVDFGNRVSSKPGAFVYTEIQINVPFNEANWKDVNVNLKTISGLLAKTWFSGLNTNTLGGIYAFDTIENAKRYAIETFPTIAASMNAAFYTRVFDASVTEAASRAMRSPYYN